MSAIFSYPDQPPWAQPVLVFQTMQLVKVWCIVVNPTTSNPAMEGGDFALAAPSVEIQDRIEDALADSERSGNYEPVRCTLPISVDARTNTLKWVNGDFEIVFELRVQSFPFFVHKMPSSWAMPLPEFTKLNKNRGRDSFFVIFVQGYGGREALAAPNVEIQDELLSALRNRSSTAS